eukprot:10174739-Alexandrium_andersonii.AAC.1
MIVDPTDRLLGAAWSCLGHPPYPFKRQAAWSSFLQAPSCLEQLPARTRWAADPRTARDGASGVACRRRALG